MYYDSFMIMGIFQNIVLYMIFLRLLYW